MKIYQVPVNILQAVVNHLESQPIRDKVAMNLLAAIEQVCKPQDTKVEEQAAAKAGPKIKKVKGEKWQADSRDTQ